MLLPTDIHVLPHHTYSLPTSQWWPEWALIIIDDGLIAKPDECHSGEQYYLLLFSAKMHTRLPTRNKKATFITSMAIIGVNNADQNEPSHPVVMSCQFTGGSTAKC
jgi:hypothetical protein